MQVLRPSRSWQVCAVLLALSFSLPTLSVASPHGREFTGYFDVSGVQEQGDLVQVTLHLKLFNHSDADVKRVIVTLVDSAPAMTFHGNYPMVKVWKRQTFIEMSQQFSVTQREFREWMAPPAQPNLIILLQDSNGKSWQKGAQISRRPLVKIDTSDRP